MPARSTTTQPEITDTTPDTQENTRGGRLQVRPRVIVLGEVDGNDETKGRAFKLVQYGWSVGTYMVSRQTVEQFKKADMNVIDNPSQYVI
jgi:hypothetical protein